MTDLKLDLLQRLREARAVVLSRLDGLSEYDMRRPLTPTGTNLLGLVKHLASMEYGYLGESFGRPPPERPSWWDRDPEVDSDMWATTEQPSQQITGIYRKACAHADVTVRQLDLDAPGWVSHWAEGERRTTLGVLLVRMVGETAQHAGHAEIVRELIDGRAGNAQDPIGGDAAFWTAWTAKVRAAADHFRT